VYVVDAIVMLRRSVAVVGDELGSRERLRQPIDRRQHGLGWCIGQLVGVDRLLVARAGRGVG
jgi:hypothetical protein